MQWQTQSAAATLRRLANSAPSFASRCCGFPLTPASSCCLKTCALPLASLFAQTLRHSQTLTSSNISNAPASSANDTAATSRVTTRRTPRRRRFRRQRPGPRSSRRARGCPGHSARLAACGSLRPCLYHQLCLSLLPLARPCRTDTATHSHPQAPIMPTLPGHATLRRLRPLATSHESLSRRESPSWSKLEALTRLPRRRPSSPPAQ